MGSSLTAAQNQDIEIIATSNLTRAGGNFSMVVNYSTLIDASQEFPDNSMMMFIRLLMRAGIRRVALAGFDGYTPDDVNYFDANMEYSFVKDKADTLNQSGKDFFAGIAEQMSVTFVTDSLYMR